MARVIDFSDRLDQTLDDVHLVKERKLYGDVRQNVFRESVFRFGWETRVAPEFDHLLDAIDAIDREHRENAEVNDQHSPIESVELVKRTDVRRGLIHRVAVTRHVGAEIAVQRRRAIPTVVQALLDPIGWRGD